MKESGVTEAPALALITPALNVARSSANTPIYTLRGIGFNTPNLSSTSPVGVYYDEIAYAYPFMSSGPLFDIERVEVLKGPQGTLYGRNTTGGLVNFIAAKPVVGEDEEFQAGLTTEFGNFDTQNLEGFFSVPLGDTLGIRLAGRLEHSGKGWQQSVTRDERLGEKDRFGLRASAAWIPTDKLSIELTASYWEDTSDTVAGQAVLANPDVPPFANPGLVTGVRDDWTNTTADWDPFDGTKAPFESNSNFLGLASRIEYDINDNLSVVSLTSYNDVERNDQNDSDGTAVEIFTLQSIGDIKSFSQELRFEGEVGPVDFIVGGYFSNDDINDNQVGNYAESSVLSFLQFLAVESQATGELSPTLVGFGALPPGQIIPPNLDLYTPAQLANGFEQFRNTTEQRNRSKSVFASVDWNISDQFDLSIGGRYTDDELKFSACSGDFNGNTLPIWNTSVYALASNANAGVPPTALVQENGCMTFTSDFSNLASFERPTLEEDNFAGRLSLQYTPNSDHLLYATLSRGYKSGAVPLLPTNVETQLEPVTQERITALEIGSKSTLFQGAVQANASAFYYDYKDKQLFSEVEDIVFTTLTRLVNVPESEVYGGEIDVNWRATDALSLRGGVSYTKTEINEFIGVNRAGQATDFAGLAFPYTPEWTINASANYDQPISDTLGLRATIVGNYQSETAASLGTEAGFEVDSYTVVNSTVGLYTLDGKWALGLYANNLFDEYYWNSVDVLTDTVFRIPSPPRTYGVRLSWKY